VSDVEAIQEKLSKQFMEDGILVYSYVSSHSKMQRYERYGFETFRGDLSAPVFASASAHLYHFLYTTDHNAVALWNSLYHVIIPHLIEERSVEELSTYFNDFSINGDRLRTRLGEENLPDTVFIDYYLLNLLRYGQNENIDIIINAIKRSFYINPIEWIAVKKNLDQFADVELFKRVVKDAGIYSPYVVASGHSLMEPEEWIDYIETLKLTREEKKELIDITLQRSLDGGYYYFHRFLERYKAMME